MKNKNISDKEKILKRQSLKFNTKGSARTRRGAEVVKEGAMANQTIMWLQKHFHAIVKPKKFTTFPTGVSEGLLYAARVTMGSVKK